MRVDRFLERRIERVELGEGDGCELAGLIGVTLGKQGTQGIGGRGAIAARGEDRRAVQSRRPCRRIIPSHRAQDFAGVRRLSEFGLPTGIGAQRVPIARLQFS